jgi:ribosomal protein L37AE/L43A
VPSELSQMTPTACPKCGGNAPLVRRAPGATKSEEVWVFRCESCEHEFARNVVD